MHGARGEEAAFLREQRRLKENGQDPSAVVWHSKRDEMSPYDIRSLDEQGKTIFIEVKSTPSTDPSTPFPISAAQLRLGMRRRRRFWIYRVTSVKESSPHIFRCQDPITAFEENRATLRLRAAMMGIRIPEDVD